MKITKKPARSGKKCSICDKGSKKAASRSHAKNKTIRRQKPNLQKVGGVLMCMRCRRTAIKNAA